MSELRTTIARDDHTLTKCPNCGAWNRALAGEPVMRGSFCIGCGADIPLDADEARDD